MKPIKNNFKYITMNKKTFLFASALAMSLTLASCSQEADVVQEKEQKTILQYESVDELTRWLKEYNTQFMIKNGGENDMSRGVKVTYSKSDIVKIAISDVKGGIRGSGGGPGGAIVGAATSSLIKFSKITVKKLLWGYIKENYLTPHVYKSNGDGQYADSIGYYHNELEYAMYDYDRESVKRPSAELVSQANARLLSMSRGFNMDGGLSLSAQLALASDIDDIREADESLSFKEYCKRLKQQHPEDAEYIDFCAEYIYTAVYANISDLEEYTQGVMYRIMNSNVDVSDRKTLYNGVQIAYASILYSQNMKFTSVDNQ